MPIATTRAKGDNMNDTLERITDLAFEVRYLSQSLMGMVHNNRVDDTLGNMVANELRKASWALDKVLKDGMTRAPGSLEETS